MKLLEQIKIRKARVAVVGLGYVGLPMALEVTGAGFPTTGFDIDGDRIEALKRGESHLLDVPATRLRDSLAAGRLQFTDDSDALANADVILISVPTPLKAELPDLSHLEAAAKDIARNLRKDQLVILESTTYPGTTEEFLSQILETSGLRAGEDFYLGFSPERINPGDTSFDIRQIPKVVGGINEASTELMEAFYSALVDRVVRVSSPRAAEMSKLLENTYRHVNIALSNEIAILCHDLDIDVWEVIDAAATKPFGFQPFYPGPGWGGHCIPVDPSYLSWRVRQMGQTAHFVELAREINKEMPGYVVQRIGEYLNEQGKSIKGSSVLILGVTYKPDVADTRESPALDIIAKLKKAGAKVSFHDPHVHSLEIDGKSLIGTELTDRAVGDADLVVVHTNHSSYDWDWVAQRARLIFDTRNALRGVKGPVVAL